MALPIPLPQQMSFITITQYFNKLHSALFVLLMVPLLLFIALYLITDATPPLARAEFQIIIASVVLADWVAAIKIFNKKIKSARIDQGLGAKLDKYFRGTIVCYSLLSFASLMLAIGFHFSGNDVFLGFSAGGSLAGGSFSLKALHLRPYLFFH